MSGVGTPVSRHPASASAAFFGTRYRATHAIAYPTIAHPQLPLNQL